MLEAVIGLVNEYFTIFSIDIDNTFETITNTNNTDNVTALESELSADGILRKVGNEFVDKKIGILCNAAYWALFTCQAPEKEVNNYLQACISNISMKYTNKPAIEFDVGDIVDINLGLELPGEIYRNRIHAIIVGLGNKGSAYVVPITPNKTDLASKSYICFESNKDVIYYDDYFTGGTALVDKTNCIKVESFIGVVGKTNKEFFERLVNMIHTAFDFREECIN